MTISAGTKLGPYELLERIGSGGMGEVYRATDTRLQRIVAVKVLLGTVAADPERLRRFEQEARTLAALNHPNILAVYDVGTIDADVTGAGTPYLVSEFLEGETLRGKLDSGHIPLRKSMEYALGVAQGLAAGHSKGIIHRDIKPENIFLTRDGRVKILDFGLAKLVQAGSGNDLETVLSRDDGTTPGMVLGTVGYMSPEQVRGEPVEATSDIFSFGAVLYEMVSGHRAFKRKSAAETMTAVLREEPPELTDSGWHGLPGLQRIVERCMEKDPALRFQSASDLAFAIANVSGSSSGAAHAITDARLRKKRTGPGLITWTAIAAGVIALCTLAWWAGRKTMVASIPTFAQITFQRGSIPAARFTHDGDTVLYAGQFDVDPLQIYSVRPSGLQPVKVDTPSATLFAVSREDQMLVGMNPTAATTYWNVTLSEVPVTGGTPRPMKDAVVSADYAPDGRTIAITRFVGGKCRLEFPVGKVLFENSGYLDYVRIGPDGKTVAFAEHDIIGDDRGWVAIADSSGKVRRLTGQYASLQGLAWRRDGREIWFTQSNEGSSFTITGVNLSGAVRSITSVPGMAILQDIAADGRVLLETVRTPSRISAFDGTTGKERPNLELNEASMLTDISPDGKAVLYEDDSGTNNTLYRVIYRKTDGSAPLTLGKGAGPVLSPDGTTVAALLFESPVKAALYPVGTGESHTLGMGPVMTATNLAWFPDGKRLLVVGAEKDKGERTYVMNTATGAIQVLGPDGFQAIAVSKDGSQLLGAMTSASASSMTVDQNSEQLTPLPGAIFDLTSKQLKPVAGLRPGDLVVRWSRDGAGILVQSADSDKAAIYRLDLATGKRTLVKQVESKDKAGGRSMFLMLAADEKSYALYQLSQSATLWIVNGVR
jgi:eukaryotic-like serine/threonine-protein kinase